MLDNKAYFDISPQLSEHLAVFPGDTPLKRAVQLDFKKGHNIVLSSLTFSCHLGAHVDAPNHYHVDGASIETRGLHYYMGLCQVISVVKKPGSRILVSDVAKVGIKAPRVLFKTSSFSDPNIWVDDFNSLSAELVEYLNEKKVILIGIDTPSIDLSDDKILEAHNVVYRHDMAILEGVTLTGVTDGLYTLIALPLKILGADASPVRAILVDDAKDVLS